MDGGFVGFEEGGGWGFDPDEECECAVVLLAAFLEEWIGRRRGHRG